MTVCLFLSFFLQGAFFLTQSIKVLYVAVYQLWWSEGYQDFADVESGVTTKVDLPFTWTCAVTSLRKIGRRVESNFEDKILPRLYQGSARWRATQWERWGILSRRWASHLSGFIIWVSSAKLTQYKVWDEADYVVPPAENGAFFVTTNLLVTSNQTWGNCPEVGFALST